MIKQLTTAASIDERLTMDNFTVIKKLFDELNLIWNNSTEEEKQFILENLDIFNDFKF